MPNIHMASRTWAVISTLGLFIAVMTDANSQPQCTPIPVGSHLDQSFLIDAPGHYCLLKDRIQPKLLSLDDSQPKETRAMATLWASDIELDLGGHRLGNEGATIETISGERSRFEYSSREPVRNISIHDGYIFSRQGNFGGDGVVIRGLGGYENSHGFPVSLASDLERFYWRAPKFRGDPEYQRLLQQEFDRAIRELPSKVSQYPARRIILERLKIQVPRYGIVVQGSGTVIRDCVIETDGHNAIYLFGPDSVIENNLIIVNGVGPKLMADAPIRLHHGDNTIIRNNKIIYKGESSSHGITLISSKNVEIDNNELSGIDKVLKEFSEDRDELRHPVGSSSQK